MSNFARKIQRSSIESANGFGKRRVRRERFRRLVVAEARKIGAPVPRIRTASRDSKKPIAMPRKLGGFR